jgi:hypothetical protein
MQSQLSYEMKNINKFSKKLNEFLNEADEQTIGYVRDIMTGQFNPDSQRKLESKPNGAKIFTLTNAMSNY